MKILVPTTRYVKDVRRLRKRGYKLEKLVTIVKLLETEQPLPAHARNHKLHGEYGGCRECHVGGDWLLIYNFTEEGEEVTLIRTGTHADLFE